MMQLSRRLRAMVAAGFLLLGGTALGAAPDGLQPNTRAETLGGLSHALDLYIYPDMAARLKAMLVADRSRYLATSGADAFAAALTDALRTLSHDQHLTVWHSHEKWSKASSNVPPGEAESAIDAAEGNGFSSLARLPGNIGYLDLRSFAGGAAATSLVDAYMKILGGTDAILIDLRQNHGGAADTIDALTGYLLGKRELLVKMFFRQPTGEITETDRFSSEPPQGRAYKGRVYILTSHATFSAAEEFAYDLKTLGRATLVGETTGGGAHPGTILPIGPDFTAFIPIGRTEGAVTKTDWEGIGVTPDVRASPQSALQTAYSMALADATPLVHSEQLDADRASAQANPTQFLRASFPH